MLWLAQVPEETAICLEIDTLGQVSIAIVEIIFLLTLNY